MLKEFRETEKETTKVGRDNQKEQNWVGTAKKVDKLLEQQICEGRERGQPESKKNILPHNKVEITKEIKMDSEDL